MLVTGKYNEEFVILEVDKREYELAIANHADVVSLPRQHTLWFEEGKPQIVTIRGPIREATEQEALKYNRAKYHFLNNNSSNTIWDANGLMLGNYVKRSNNDYWAPQFKGTIVRLTIDEMILIDTQVPRGIFEYIDLDDEWLDQFGFFIDRSRAHIKYNELGNIFQLNKLNQYAGVTDQNSAEIEAGITNGTIPLVRYEFTWGAVHIRHVHKLQNIASELAGLELVRKDGKR